MVFDIEEQNSSKAWDLHDACLAVLEDAYDALADRDLEVLRKRILKVIRQPVVRVCYLRSVQAGKLEWESLSDREAALNLAIHNAIIALNDVLRENELSFVLRLDSRPENWERGGRLDSPHWDRFGHFAATRGLIDERLAPQVRQISDRIEADVRHYHERARHKRFRGFGHLGEFFMFL